MTWGDLAILAENPKKIKCVVCEMVGELGDLATLVKKRKNVKAFQRKKNVCVFQTKSDLGDLAIQQKKEQAGAELCQAQDKLTVVLVTFSLRRD